MSCDMRKTHVFQTQSLGIAHILQGLSWSFGNARTRSTQQDGTQFGQHYSYIMGFGGKFTYKSNKCFFPFRLINEVFSEQYFALFCAANSFCRLKLTIHAHVYLTGLPAQMRLYMHNRAYT